MAHRTISHYRQLMNNWYNNFTVWGENCRQAQKRGEGYIQIILYYTSTCKRQRTCCFVFQFKWILEKACLRVIASTTGGSCLCPFYTWSLSQLNCVERADQCIIEKGVANAQFTATRRINGKAVKGGLWSWWASFAGHLEWCHICKCHRQTHKAAEILLTLK